MTSAFLCTNISWVKTLTCAYNIRETLQCCTLTPEYVHRLYPDPWNMYTQGLHSNSWNNVRRGCTLTPEIMYTSCTLTPEMYVVLSTHNGVEISCWSCSCLTLLTLPSLLALSPMLDTLSIFDRLLERLELFFRIDATTLNIRPLSGGAKKKVKHWG